MRGLLANGCSSGPANPLSKCTECLLVTSKQSNQWMRGFVSCIGNPKVGTAKWDRVGGLWSFGPGLLSVPLGKWSNVSFSEQICFPWIFVFPSLGTAQSLWKKVDSTCRIAEGWLICKVLSSAWCASFKDIRPPRTFSNCGFSQQLPKNMHLVLSPW